MSEEQAKQPEPAAPAPAPEAPRALNTIERINLLADLANAAQDEEIVKLLKSRKNGERLYSLFVGAVSEEIEGIMNPAQAQAPRVLNDAAQIATQIYTMMQRVGGVLAAIEQGPGLFVLQTVAQQLGGRMPQQAAQQYTPQQPGFGAPQPVQPPQSSGSAEGRIAEQPPGSRGRGGALGSW